MSAPKTSRANLSTGTLPAPLRAFGTGVADAIQRIVTWAQALPFDSSNNLRFNRTAARVLGVFSGAPHASRTLLQSTTLNGNSVAGILPNGTGASAGWAAYNGPDPDNAALLFAGIDATRCMVSAQVTGTGTQRPVDVDINGTAYARVNTNGDVQLGPVVAGGLTTMTAGFPYIPSGAGAPTGAPTARTGFAALYFDRTNGKFYAHDGTAWKSVTLA